jgi:hypothetical protein
MLGRWLRWTCLISAALPLAAALVHVLELPNKLALDGPLWLVVQQQLYAGWAGFMGAFHWVAFFAIWGLAVATMGRFPIFLPTVVSALCISAALAVSVMFVGPLNAILGSWTPASLPVNWAGFRLRWQLLQILEFALLAAGYLYLLRALDRER